MHKTIGIDGLPLLAVVAFSGVALSFHDPMERVTGWFLPVEGHHHAPQSAVATGSPVPVDDAVVAARSALPEGRLRRVYLPREPAGSYRITFNLPGEAWNTYGASSVWLDQYSGQVLKIHNATEAAGGDQFLEWQFPLHNGDALGLPGRGLVFLAGLMPALFFATGVYMWWRKRTAGRAAVATRSSRAL